MKCEQAKYIIENPDDLQDRSKLEEHLQTCDECRQYATFLQILAKNDSIEMPSDTAWRQNQYELFHKIEHQSFLQRYKVTAMALASATLVAVFIIFGVVMNVKSPMVNLAESDLIEMVGEDYLFTVYESLSSVYSPDLIDLDEHAVDELEAAISVDMKSADILSDLDDSEIDDFLCFLEDDML